MSPRPSTLLGLVLCLGQTIHMQPALSVALESGRGEGDVPGAPGCSDISRVPLRKAHDVTTTQVCLSRDLPKPSIWAKPGLMVPRGRPVTFVCQGPAGAKLFRLEKDGRCAQPDQKNVSQDGSQETKARFHIPAVSEDTVGSYRCIYHQGSHWSVHSEPLELQVTEVVSIPSTPPSGAPRVLSSTPRSTPRSTPSSAPSSTPSSTPVTHTKPLSAGLSSKYLYILVGTSVAVLLCLLLLVLLLVRCRRQRKHESLHSKGGEQRPQERLNPAADITEGTPDEAAVCAPPEKNGETPSPSPDAGDAQEVTYAQLDPRALTLRAAQAVSPQPTEPPADGSTYAELPRH